MRGGATRNRDIYYKPLDNLKANSNQILFMRANY